MSDKKYDVCIAVGEYINSAGEKKKRYKTIGAVMQHDNGPFLLLDASILSMQLFALANKERRESVIVSLFDAKREPGTSAPSGVEAEDVPF